MKFNVTLTGTIKLTNIEAADKDEALDKAMEIAESYMIHEIIDDGKVEEASINS